MKKDTNINELIVDIINKYPNANIQDLFTIVNYMYHYQLPYIQDVSTMQKKFSIEDYIKKGT